MGKIGRNSICLCGSTKKYKNCCFKNTVVFYDTKELRKLIQEFTFHSRQIENHNKAIQQWIDMVKKKMYDRINKINFMYAFYFFQDKQNQNETLEIALIIQEVIGKNNVNNRAGNRVNDNKKDLFRLLHMTILYNIFNFNMNKKQYNIQITDIELKELF